MPTIDKLRDTLNDLIDKLEVIQILHAKLSKDIQELALGIEDLDKDLEEARNPSPVIETAEELDVYRANLGREVRVTNPGPGECEIGTIRRVDDYYVHIDFRDGTSRRRSSTGMSRNR